MKTIKNLVLFFLAIALVTGCNKVSYRKTAGGMPYKLFRGNGTQTIQAGYYLKLNITQKIKDSIYFTTEGKLPYYLMVNGTPQPYDVSEVWTKLKKGDSLITTQMMDTFINRNPGNIQPQFKKGDRVVTYFKILDVFTSDSAARADDEKTKKEWLESEVVFVGKYLADKNISAQKTPSGAYVHVINPGTGDLIDSGKYVSVNYTGTSFSGKIFDSNTDTSFHHVEPLSFVVNGGRMTKGFDESMRFMRNGGTARLYVPSMLAYGANPNTPLIKPYEHVMFDIAITDVKDEAPPQRGVPPVLPNTKVDKPKTKKKN